MFQFICHKHVSHTIPYDLNEKVANKKCKHKIYVTNKLKNSRKHRFRYKKKFGAYIKRVKCKVMVITTINVFFAEKRK